MKKNKLFLSISMAICVICIAITLGIAFSQPKHKHELGEARVYHVSQDSIYYTRQCDDGHAENFSTSASLIEVIKSVTADDKIVLDEDIVLTEDLKVWSFVSGALIPHNLNVNLDLNGHKISSDAEDTTGAMIKFSANLGTINFNIKNGKLYSEDFKYLFDFQNSPLNNSTKNIVVNIDNVECMVKGNDSTPLFVDDSVSNIELNATNSKFVATKAGESDLNIVGAFINSQNSVFNFTGCEFEGADALYVKQGRVNLDNCNLNSILTANRAWDTTGNPFYATGASILAESYNSSMGCTRFNVVIFNSVLKAINGIYLVQGNEQGYPADVNEASSIIVKSRRKRKPPRPSPPDAA